MKRKYIFFDKDQTLLLKGYAIILIILHNFCHWLPNAIHENEYTYNLENSLLWLKNVVNVGPDLILNFFSFWGHYGVAIFLFLSGYGLVKRYESCDNDNFSKYKFIKKEVIKLWKLLVLPLLFYILFIKVKNFIPLLTFTANIIPTADVIQGPWWFFSLIFQCYLTYILFFYKNKNIYLYIAIIFSFLTLLYGINSSNAILHYIKYNIIGWCIPFSLGIIVARKRIAMPLWIFYLSLPLFLLSEFNKYLWVFSPVFFILFSILLAELKNKILRKILVFWGIISPSVFVLHSLVRTFLLRFFLERTNLSISIILLIYIFLILLVASVYQWLIKKSSHLFFS